MSHRVIRGLLVASALCALTLSGGVASAAAAPWSVPGSVNDVSSADGKVYVAGNFSSADGQPRFRLAALNAADGSLAAWNPSLTGIFPPNLESGGFSDILASPTRVFVTGDYRVPLDVDRDVTGAIEAGSGATAAAFPFGLKDLHTVGNRLIGIPSRPYPSRLVSVDLSTGAVSEFGPTFSWVAGGSTFPAHLVALAVKGDVAYVGGAFNRAAGESRESLAAINLANGKLTTWNPSVRTDDTACGCIGDITILGTTVFVSGSFDEVNGLPQAQIAALGSTTGELYDWTADDIGITGRDIRLFAFGSAVYALDRDMQGDGGRAFDAYTGERLAWDLGDHAHAIALTPLDDALVAGGAFGVPQNGLRVVPQADPAAYEDDPAELGSPRDVPDPIVAAPAPPAPPAPPRRPILPSPDRGVAPANPPTPQSGTAPPRGPRCKVPQLKKLTRSKAIKALRAARCATGRITTAKKQQRRTVLKVKSQSLKPGTSRPVGTRVSFTLA